MAERRMFAKTIVLSDAFLDMPITARCLYFTLGMVADDDGFVNSPKSVMRQIGASQDDMNVLLLRKFLLAFDDGVIVIKHWRVNNYLRSDRYKETVYTDNMEKLSIDEQGIYHVGIPSMGIPSIDKDRLDKDSKDKDIYTTRFEEFWKSYPKKSGKGAAEKSFMKIKPNEQLFKKIMDSLEAHKGCEQWTKENGQFIPYPATWLNQMRWEDEVNMRVEMEFNF